MTKGFFTYKEQKRTDAQYDFRSWVVGWVHTLNMYELVTIFIRMRRCFNQQPGVYFRQSIEKETPTGVRRP